MSIITLAQQIAHLGPHRVRSWDFSSEAADFGTESFGDNVGIFDSGTYRPEIDTVIKPPGCTASLRMKIGTNSRADSSGQWFMNFGNPNGTVMYGANSQFNISWWQWFGPTFATYKYLGGGGWKQCIISAGDLLGCSVGNPGLCNGSCTPLEVVPQNTNHRGYPQMYNSCSGCAGGTTTGHVAFVGFEETYPWPGGGDFKMQNMMPAPYCLKSVADTGNLTGCFPYYPNEWMQFQVVMRPGFRDNDGFAESHVDMWVCRQGQPKQQLFSWYHPIFEADYSYMLCAGSPAIDQRWGKIWLTPYNTTKSDTEVHADDFTRYAGVVVSDGTFIPMDDSDLGVIPPGPVDSKYVIITG